MGATEEPLQHYKNGSFHLSLTKLATTMSTRKINYTNKRIIMTTKQIEYKIYLNYIPKTYRYNQPGIHSYT